MTIISSSLWEFILKASATPKLPVLKIAIQNNDVGVKSSKIFGG